MAEWLRSRMSAHWGEADAMLRCGNANFCAGFRTPAALISPQGPMAGVRKASRHEIASGGSGPSVPREDGAAKRLWRFGHAGGANEVRPGRVERYFCGAGMMSRSVQMNAL
jgi:hypothetical protein